VNFWDRMQQLRADHDVLNHPFYVRWSAGELSAEELARYGGEYRHAVVALAEAAASAAATAPSELRPGLGAHAREEAEHVAVWDDFARAVGADLDRRPLPETVACAETWAGSADRSLLRSLVAVYAIEAGQPAISETKLAGLRAHYGVDAAPGTTYFELHAERDHEHAAAGRELIDRLRSDADEAELLVEAEAVLTANWSLLDGIEALA
jgi:pyrroloquinoline-quinone synthase